MDFGGILIYNKETFIEAIAAYIILWIFKSVKSGDLNCSIGIHVRKKDNLNFICDLWKE